MDDSQRDVWESVQNLITAETHTSALPSRGAALQFPLLWTLLSHRQAHLAVRPLLGRMLGRAVSRLLALMVRVMSTPEASTYSSRNNFKVVKKKAANRGNKITVVLRFLGV